MELFTTCKLHVLRVFLNLSSLHGFFIKCFTSLHDLQGKNDKGFLPDVLIILLADTSNDLVKAPRRLLITCFHGYERAPDLRPGFHPAPNED